MRDRLIKLLDDVQDKGFIHSKNEDEVSCYVSNSIIADYLLADGWTRPPMSIGQTCYILRYDFSKQKDYVEECKVSCLTQKKNGSFAIRISETKYSATHNFTPDDIGKTVFLTREEAEQALKGGVE